MRKPSKRSLIFSLIAALLLTIAITGHWLLSSPPLPRDRGIWLPLNLPSDHREAWMDDITAFMRVLERATATAEPDEIASRMSITSPISGPAAPQPLGTPDRGGVIVRPLEGDRMWPPPEIATRLVTPPEPWQPERASVVVESAGPFERNSAVAVISWNVGWTAPPARMERRIRWRIRLSRTPAGLQITGLSYVSGLEIGAPRPFFSDVTRESGLANAFQRPAGGLGGIAVEDFDQDGIFDLVLARRIDGVRVLRGDGAGGFHDVTASAGLHGVNEVISVLAADLIPGSGPDLYLTRFAFESLLLANRGDGTFDDVTAEFGAPWQGVTIQSAAADIDQDGLLDLYSVNLANMHTQQTGDPGQSKTAGPNQLFRNLGGGHFEDITTLSGTGDRGWGNAASFSDIDLDGDADLYVANDSGDNVLYRNLGQGRFEDITATSGTLDSGPGMNASWADADGDGHLDLYVSNIWSRDLWVLKDQTWMMPGIPRIAQTLRHERTRASIIKFNAGNSLLRNQGDGAFVDISQPSGTYRTGWSWGAVFFDYDLDGDLDLYVCNGYVNGRVRKDKGYEFLKTNVAEERGGRTWGDFVRALGDSSFHGYEPNSFFRNEGNGTFTEIGYVAGLDRIDDSRSVVAFDLEGDGDPDLLVKNLTSTSVLFRNDAGRPERALVVHLDGPEGNPRGIGARISVKGNEQTQVREVTCGSGYLTTGPPNQVFGLAPGLPVQVKVRWPDGHTQIWEGLRPGQRVHLRPEMKHPASREPLHRGLHFSDVTQP